MSQKDKKEKKPLLINVYLDEHKKYCKIYGKEYTLVFMQVGSFYEAYSTNNDGPDLSKISLLLDVQLVRKNKQILEVSIKNPNLLGIPTGAINKYKKKLVSVGWTLILIDQVTPPPDVTRKISGIYSPGTCLELNTSESSNIVSIYLTESCELLSSGLSTFDLSTGKGIVHEIYSKKGDDKLTLDEVFRWLVMHNPKEIVIAMDNYDEKKMDKYITYLELEKKVYHIKKQIPKEFFKLKYQNEYLSKIWPIKGDIQPIEQLEIAKMPNIIISLMLLLNFSIDHNEKIVTGLPYPEIYRIEETLILGNNAPLQLNVIENATLEYAPKQGKRMYKSLLDVIDKTCTAVGKRRLKSLLLSPYIDYKTIKQRYAYVEEFKNNFSFYKDVEISLVEIIDIEKLHRKVSMMTLPPMDFVKLNDCYKSLLTIMNDVIDNKVCRNMNIKDLRKELKEFMSDYNKIINITEAGKYSLVDMRGSFFNKKYNTKIDKLDDKVNESRDFLNNICTKLSKHISESDEKKKNIDQQKDNDEKKISRKTEKITLKSTEKEGRFLEMTKKRADELKENIKSKKIKITDEYTLNSKDINYKERPAGKTVKLTFPKLNDIDITLSEIEKEIENLLHKEWINLLKIWHNKYDELFSKLVNFLGDS
jgi:DNA mismatch repair protein MutS